MKTYLDYALEYHDAGLNVVPFWKDESGKTRFPTWSKEREGQTPAGIRQMFGRVKYEILGLALLCTDGIEGIDIDVKHDPTGTIAGDWFKEVMADARGKDALQACLVQKTKSGGYHVIYKTGIIEGNQKLAHKNGSPEAVIETRGKGGLLFIYPTPGYEIKRGAFDTLVGLSNEERGLFIASARALSERDDATPAPVEPAKPARTAPDGESPVEAFNAAHSVQDIAERYGWKVGKRAGKFIHLSKPGASDPRDIHASIVTTQAGEQRFYPFTTSTHYDAQKCYSPFAMYAVEEHRGDFKAAAKDLAAKGYGKPVLPAKAAAAPPTQDGSPTPPPVLELFERARLTKYDYHAPIQDEAAILQVTVDGTTYKIGGYGQIGVITGHQKSGKSFVTACMVAASLTPREECLCFTLQAPGKRIGWFDNEQANYFYQTTQKRLHHLAERNDNIAQYDAFHLRNFTPLDRLAIIEHYVYTTSNLGVLVVDGFVDLIQDYNNLLEAQALVGRLMKWTYERRILLIGMLHVNKGDGKIRGHLGSELKNKADFLITVKKSDDKVFTVTNTDCRYGEFPSFEFTRDESGMPVYERPALVGHAHLIPTVEPAAPAASWGRMPERLERTPEPTW